MNWRATAPELGTVLISHKQVQARVVELGQEITRDYATRSPLLVCVLKGAFMFMGDLSREIDRPLEVDFMAVSSYGNSTRTSGVVRIVKDLAQLHNQLAARCKPCLLGVTDFGDHRNRCADHHVSRCAWHNVEERCLAGDQSTGGNDDEAGDSLFPRRSEHHRVGIQTFPDGERGGDVVLAARSRVPGVGYGGNFLYSELRR